MQWYSATTEKLSTNFSHIIRNASFCIINTTYLLRIIGNASHSKLLHSAMTPLYNIIVDLLSLIIQNLTLQRLVLRGCGGYLRGLDVIKLINSTDSPLKFSQLSVSSATTFTH